MRRRRAVAAALAAAALPGCGTDVPLRAKERSFAVRGPVGRLQVTDGGSLLDTPVVFVHGLGGSAAHWHETMQLLRDKRRAVAFDLRGHGDSDPPSTTPSGWFIDALAGDVAAVADGLGLSRFALVGHSVGASVAIAYAGAYPQRVAALVPVGAIGRVPAEQSVPAMQALRNDYARVTAADWTALLAGAQPDTAQRVRRELQRMPRETVLPIIGGLLSYDPGPALRAYGGPILLIDTPLVDEPHALHRQHPELPRRVIDGTSHWPQLDKPREFASLLSAFLGRLP